MLYKAFISYSHGADHQLAPALQSALHRFTKPWYRLRALRVFRDKTNLAANPGLWSSIEKALGESEYFILLASPQAAASPWVQRETDHWLHQRSNDQILIVLTDGELVWDSIANDFDWSRTNALPKNLEKRFKEEPLFIDLRWAKTEEQVSLNNPRFRDAIADLAVPLHGLNKDEVIGEDVRQHRVFKRVASGAIALLVLLLTASIVAAAIAIQQRNIADQQREIAVEAAQKERDAADRERKAREDADEAAKKEREARILADERRREAERQRQIAENAVQTERGARATVLGQEPGREFEALQVAVQAAGPSLKKNVASLPAAVLQGLNAAATAVKYSLPLRGHTDEVEAAAFSPDGSRVITSGKDRTARLWDTSNGRLIATFQLHPNSNFALAHVAAASFSCDGARVVTVHNDYREYTAQTWDARTGEPLVTFKGHTRDVNSALFSPDGGRIVTTSSDYTMRLWDAYTGQQLREIKSPRGQTWGAVTIAAFSPDGLRLISSHQDNYARLWDARSGESLKRFPLGHGAKSASFSPDGTRAVIGNRVFDVSAERPTAAAAAGRQGYSIASALFSPDGSRRVSHSDHTPAVVDSRSGEPIKPIYGKFVKDQDAHRGDINSAVFSPDGHRIVTASQDETARLWDARTGELLGTFQGHSDRVFFAAFSPDGRRIVTTSGDRTARIWDTHPDRSLVTLGTQADPSGKFDDKHATNFAAFSPDGARAITAHNNGVVQLWDTRAGQIVARLPHTEPVEFAAFSPDGSRLAIAGKTRTALWDALTNHCIETLEGRAGERGATTFSPDSRFLLTITQDEWLMWNARTGQLLKRGDSYAPESATFSSDGKLIVLVGSSINIVRFVNTRNWKSFGLPDRDGGYGVFKALSPDRRRGVTNYPSDNTRSGPAHPDRAAQLWDVQTGRPLSLLEGHAGRFAFAAFSPDSERVVTTSEDRTARVWDARTGKLLATLEGHTAEVKSASFSSDGRRILTVSHDRTARLWDAGSGHLLAIFQGHTDSINSAAFSSDGARVITASRDGTAKVYSAVTHDLAVEYLAQAFKALRHQPREFGQIREYERYLNSIAR